VILKGTNAGLGLLLLRVALGIIFVMHGLGKLVGPPFVGGGMEVWIGFVTGLGFPVPVAVAWFGALLETLGGVALMIGAGVPVAALLLAIEMAIGAWKVHIAHGFDVFHFGDAAARGYEYNLALIGGLLALVFGGPGILALQLRPKQ